jgi:hypothetical protein
MGHGISKHAKKMKIIIAIQICIHPIKMMARLYCYSKRRKVYPLVPLDFGGQHFTNEAFTYLKNLENLKCLQLSHLPKVTTQKYLQGLENLKEINLNYQPTSFLVIQIQELNAGDGETEKRRGK